MPRTKKETAQITSGTTGAVNYDDQIKDLKLTDNEHYRNELALQTAVSIALLNSLENKIALETVKRCFTEVYNLPMLKRTKKTISKIHDDVLNSVTEEFAKELAGAKEAVEANSKLTSDFLANAELPAREDQQEQTAVPEEQTKTEE